MTKVGKTVTIKKRFTEKEDKTIAMEGKSIVMDLKNKL